MRTISRKSTRAACTVLVLAGLVGCGGDREQREERGLTPEVEEAVPTSKQDMMMTDTERKTAEDEEEDARSAAEFDEAQ